MWCGAAIMSCIKCKRFSRAGAAGNGVCDKEKLYGKKCPQQGRCLQPPTSAPTFDPTSAPTKESRKKHAKMKKSMKKIWGRRMLGLVQPTKLDLEGNQLVGNISAAISGMDHKDDSEASCVAGVDFDDETVDQPCQEDGSTCHLKHCSGCKGCMRECTCTEACCQSTKKNHHPGCHSPHGLMKYRGLDQRGKKVPMASCPGKGTNDGLAGQHAVEGCEACRWILNTHDERHLYSGASGSASPSEGESDDLLSLIQDTTTEKSSTHVGWNCA
jgi:hypothetical protein